MEMKIAICDDDVNFQSSFAKQVVTTFKNAGYNIEIFLPSASEELLADSLADIDVYFLDIDMPGLNGIQAAELLRMQGSAEFIFVSAYDQYILTSMKVKPIAFIRKAYVITDLENAINNLIVEINRKKKTVLLTDGKKFITIPIHLVLYFYSDKDYVIINYDNGEVSSIRQKLSVVENVVSQYSFIRIHSRYLINMNKIKGFYKEYITMEDSKDFPISRSYYKIVQQNIMNWFRRNNT